MRARSWKRPLAALIIEVAAGQHGVISSSQLLAIGVSRAGISRRLACGRLQAIYPGVHAVGGIVPSREGRLTAAVLAAGEGSVVSHRAAGDLSGIRSWSGCPEVTVPRFRSSRSGLIVHTSKLARDERTLRDGIPITTPARTIFDLAAVVDLRGLRSAINEAHALRLPLRPSLPTLLERHPRRPGAANLRFLLAEDQVGRGITRRQFEAAFFAFLAEEGFPPPLINHPIPVGAETFTVDFAWPSARLIVETDGDAFHSSPQRRAADKRRDRRLRAIGWSVIRVAWEHLHGDRTELRGDLWLALGRPAEVGRRAPNMAGLSPPPPRSASPPRPS